jgi:hypothetical protein
VKFGVKEKKKKEPNCDVWVKEMKKKELMACGCILFEEYSVLI